MSFMPSLLSTFLFVIGATSANTPLQAQQTANELLAIARASQSESLLQTAFVNLGELNDPQITPALVEILKSRADLPQSARRDGYLALGRIANDVGVQFLLNSAAVPNMKDVLYKGARSDVDFAFTALTNFRDALSIQLALTNILDNRDTYSYSHQLLAMRILVREGIADLPVVAPSLIKATDFYIHSDDSLLLGLAVAAAGLTGNRAQIPRLLELLNSGALNIESASATALGNFEDPMITTALIDKLKLEPITNVPVIRSLIIALGNRDDRRAIAPIKRIMHRDIDRFFRHESASALFKLRGGELQEDGGATFDQPNRVSTSQKARDTLAGMLYVKDLAVRNCMSLLLSPGKRVYRYE